MYSGLTMSLFIDCLIINLYLNVLLKVWQDSSSSVMTTTPSCNYSLEEKTILDQNWLISSFSTGSLSTYCVILKIAI